MMVAGTLYEVGTPEYEATIPIEQRSEGSRSIIMLDVHKVSSVSTPVIIKSIL